VTVLDPYEYKLRSEEIKELIKEKDYQQAAEIADTIDWTRVRSVSTLCTISDLYKVNRRYNEAKILLDQAYKRNSNDKKIVYSLCELCIKMDDIIGATEYYKEYTRMAPTDDGKFILLYKIYEAQDVSLEERIGVLEELKKRDYTRKWGYELAYLYHRVGLATKCVEECDELITWFRDGKYVKKAMELKMLHQQLTESQENVYNSMAKAEKKEDVDEHNTVYITKHNAKEDDTDDIQVKTMDVGQYSTINIQKALAESMKDVLVADDNFAPLLQSENVSEEEVLQEEEREEVGSVTEAIMAPMMMQDTGELQELYAGAGDDAEMAAKLQEGVTYNNEFEEESEELTAEQELLPAEEEQNETDDYTRIIPVIRDEDLQASESLSEEETEVQPKTEENIPDSEEEINGFDDLKAVGEEHEESEKGAYIKLNEPYIEGQPLHIEDRPVSQDTMVYTPRHTPNVVYSPLPDIDISKASKEELMDLINQKVQEALENALNGQSMVTPENKYANIAQDTPPVSMQKMLSQEYNGQISLVVPEQEKVEKQITGQLNIEDVLSEWENTKKQSQERYQEQLKQQLKEQTGSLFTDYDVKVRDAILKEMDGKKTIYPDSIDKEYEKYLDKMNQEKEASPDEEAEDVAEVPVEQEELPEVEELVEIEEAENTEEISEEKEEIAEEEPAEEEVFEEETEENTEDASEESREEAEEESADEAEEEVNEETSEEGTEESEDSADSGEVTETEEAEKDSEEESASDEKESNDSKSESEEPNDGSRDMTDEELSLFSTFVQTKQAKRDLIRELDKVSLASYTGNVLVTGDANDETVELAKSVLKYAQVSDPNFTGKTGKISGQVLNNKDVETMIGKLSNGGLIIEKASEMSAETVKTLLRVLNQDNQGVLIIMQDTAKAVRRMVEHFDGMREMFNVHIKIEELSDDTLVAYGRKYAEHMEYSIDEMGMLALHTRIEAMQTSDHIVTVADVRSIVDSAIEKAKKKNLKHFSDILFGKRYDDEDMIILKERDFDN
jgi:hypothetical protein